MSNTADINTSSLSTFGDSWRTSDGILLQSDGRSPAEFFATLSGGFPEVNTIRVDFNIYTLSNPTRLESWRIFISAAVDAGYKLIIENSDGAMANNSSHFQSIKNAVGNPENLGGANALNSINTIPIKYDPNFDYLDSSVEYIEKISQDWGAMLDWFHQPENQKILDAVYGWELLNEPQIYGANASSADLYSAHMSSLIAAHSAEFGDKKILVGGLNYSALFGPFSEASLDRIRDAAAERLVWSVHMYPGWIVPDQVLDPDGDQFSKNINLRIGNVLSSGDDILLTETHLFTQNGSLNYLSNDKYAISSFNMQQEWLWFAENGIGVSWWPPFARQSALVNHLGKPDWAVYAESAALSHDLWSHRETAENLKPSEHFGTSMGNNITITGLGNALSDYITRSLVSNDATKIIPTGMIGNHGLYFGFAGNDTITGSNDTLVATKGVDMLYGGDGNDVINGQSGNDWLFGGNGNDTINGGAGNDVIIDRAGGSEIHGGAGNDYIQAVGGKIYGDDGNDTLLFASGDSYTAVGGAGADTFVVMGSGTVTVRDITNGSDKLSLSFWADDPDVERVLVKMHLDGKGQQTGDILITNEHGGFYRISGAYTKVVDFKDSYFTDTGDIMVLYEYATQLVDGKFYGSERGEIINLYSGGDYWGKQGSDLFIASNASVRIRDFEIHAKGDIIDLSAWNLSGFDDLIITNRLTGQGGATNEVMITDAAGHSLRVALYENFGTNDPSLGADDLSADMFIF